MEKKPKISVAIITHNEEKNIPRCLQAAAILEPEFIIIDSHSTDNTLEIAKKFNAKCFSEDWKGFSEQKNSLIEKCNSEWILFLDADEVLSPELSNEILEAFEKQGIDGYSINRKTHYLGKLMNYAWRPDWNLRLVRKTSNPRWLGGIVHESLQIDGNIQQLHGDMVHYSYRDITHHFQKMLDYAHLSAQSYHQSGKKFRLMNLVLNPLIAFFRLFLMHRGYLDGIRGFIAAASSFAGTFMKYLYLWELEQKQRDS